jgi:hypothetical protein
MLDELIDLQKFPTKKEMYDRILVDNSNPEMINVYYDITKEAKLTFEGDIILAVLDLEQISYEIPPDYFPEAYIVSGSPKSLSIHEMWYFINDYHRKWHDCNYINREQFDLIILYKNGEYLRLVNDVIQKTSEDYFSLPLLTHDYIESKRYFFDILNKHFDILNENS